jgi:hypothetical protein
LVDAQIADDRHELEQAQEMKQLRFALYDYYGTLRPLDDVLEERLSEVADDEAGQKIGLILGQAIDRRASFEDARSEIFTLLCDH